MINSTVYCTVISYWSHVIYKRNPCSLLQKISYSELNNFAPRLMGVVEKW